MSLNLRRSRRMSGPVYERPSFWKQQLSLGTAGQLLGAEELVCRQRFPTPFLVFGLESKCAPKYPRVSWQAPMQ